jgi:hypothetical protein
MNQKFIIMKTSVSFLIILILAGLTGLAQDVMFIKNRIFVPNQQAETIFKECQILLTDEIINFSIPDDYVLTEKDQLSLQFLRSDIYNATIALKNNRIVFNDMSDTETEFALMSDYQVLKYEGSKDGLEMYFKLYKICTKKFEQPLSGICKDKIRDFEKHFVKNFNKYQTISKTFSAYTSAE